MLDLGGNRLINLPESIGNLRKLDELNLWGNRLKDLPESMKNLKSLKYLNLASTPIRDRSFDCKYRY